MDLDSAVRGSHPDRAAKAALTALRNHIAAAEVVRAAARAFAATIDGSEAAPRGMVALSSALNLLPSMQPRFHALPVLQAIAFVASEKKTARPVKPPSVVAGEVTHLGRSFLFAVRSGDLAEAEAIFLGMVTEGRERKMAGDMLFRAAIEDMGEGGRKLMIAMKSWQLARSLGFKDARALLRPAIQYLVAGPRDRAPFESILAALGKDWVDLDALASGGRPLDEPSRGRIREIAAAPNPSTSLAATLSLLRDGYAAVSIAEGLAIEAARRVIAAPGYDLDRARALMYAHATRSVLAFGRTNERLYALFQSALRVRSPDPGPALVRKRQRSGEGEELLRLAGEFDARKPAEAVERIASYLSDGFAPARLFDVLANYAARDSAIANGGINVILADVCASEFAASRAPEIPMALAKMIAASPKDQAAYESWAPGLPT